jgi:acyl dehydratase
MATGLDIGETRATIRAGEVWRLRWESDIGTFAAHGRCLVPPANWYLFGTSQSKVRILMWVWKQNPGPTDSYRNKTLKGKPKYYWEDFKVGDTAPIGERMVDKDEVIAFAKAYDPQPFHIDEDAAKESIFGCLIASGWHTVSMVMRMTVDSYLRDSASLGSPGVDSVRWLKPVRPGDTIRATRKVLETRASKSRPDMGVVKTRWEVFNQDDEPVMTMEGYGMFQRREPGESS